METPQQIITEAKELIEMYGSNVEYLGKNQGADYYVFKFPEDSDTGFPFVYRYVNGSVETITGFKALGIIGLFVKN